MSMLSPMLVPHKVFFPPRIPLPAKIQPWFIPFPTQYPCPTLPYFTPSAISPYQEFQYFLVIDFEATCEKDKPIYPQEIIEFPSVLVNSSTGQIESCFHVYVRPESHPVLSDFCKELTGIQQDQVDKGMTLREALIAHDEWVQNTGIKNFAVVTWSDSDCKVFLRDECSFKNIKKPSYFNQWIDLRVPFSEVYGKPRKLKEAVETAGLSWNGRAHSGLDDAMNTARLLVQIMQKGYKLSITGSLTEQSTTTKNTATVKSTMKPIVLQYHPCCYCGVKSSVWTKPGSENGCESVFFGCGKWTPYRGAVCRFKWSSQ